jgi:hypothetical protein
MQDRKFVNLELLTSSARGGNLYALTTTDPIVRVFGTDYFDRFAEHGLRKTDRVIVTADMLADEPSCAWLLVLGNEKGHVRVKQLGAVQ